MLPNDALWISIAWHNSQWVKINSEGAFLFFFCPWALMRFHEIKLQIIKNNIVKFSWASRKNQTHGHIKIRLLLQNYLQPVMTCDRAVRATFIFTNANAKRPKQAVQLCTKVIDDHQFSLQLNVFTDYRLHWRKPNHLHQISIRKQIELLSSLVWNYFWRSILIHKVKNI